MQMQSKDDQKRQKNIVNAQTDRIQVQIRYNGSIRWTEEMYTIYIYDDRAMNEMR